MNIITPKKALNFDQIHEMPSSPAAIEPAHYTSSFEVCGDEEDQASKPFMRGQTRNLSKNIKEMFKNVIKLQLDALAQLEKFYEAQLVKVEADRHQNLKLNPTNRHEINEFFDRQLALLEERVHINLENIAKDKQRKMTRSSASSLKFEKIKDESDESSTNIRTEKITKKQLFSQKLAHIISSNQMTCNELQYVYIKCSICILNLINSHYIK